MINSTKGIVGCQAVRSSMFAAVFVACATTSFAIESGRPPLLQNLSLAGEWRFRLDPNASGRTQRWYGSELPDRVFLPGTTDQNGFGELTKGISKDAAGFTCLSRVHRYEGLAWYQKEVTIPTSWQEREVDLYLERCHWQTEVWIDEKSFGTQDSLSAPHVYSLRNSLSPGRHRITICVDNTYRLDIGRFAHSIAEDTQTNWNGIIGAIELRPRSAVHFDGIQVRQGADQRHIVVDWCLRNDAQERVSGRIRVEITKAGRNEGAIVASAEAAVTIPSGVLQNSFELTGDFASWSSWDPVLYNLRATWTGTASHAEESTTFGVRKIASAGKKLLLNGAPLYLRGTLECGEFPLTGHPPTDIPTWDRILSQIRSYGMNHVRFNSWCPPDAAFTAADRLGILIQAELPVATKIDSIAKPEVLTFMKAEAARIRKAYGNHPSFGFLALGNQLEGDWAALDAMTAELKQADSRQLVTFTADHARMDPGPASDYFVGLGTLAGGRFRRRTDNWTDGPQPSSDYELSAHLRELNVPVIYHELGQWAIYPNYDQIAKYTGVLRPRVLEASRDTAIASGIGDLTPLFQQASGRFGWILWKDEIETALRTKDLAGFQIFQLHDMPGMGEVLVGLLDVFRDSKRILTPEEFRQFCSDTVPLLTLPKFVWTSEETLVGAAQVAHYGKAPLSKAAVEWRLVDQSGETRVSGAFEPMDLDLGLSTVGELRLPLATLDSPQRLRIELSVRGTESRNSWNLWVFPRPTKSQSAKIDLCRTWDNALPALRAGKRVLLALDATSKTPNTLPSHFYSVGKSIRIFSQPPNMGLACDPAHPALASFPTAFHADMQWWEMMRVPAACFDLTSAPAELTPIVYAIDDFHFNRRLAFVFEANVGSGKLLACSWDLLEPARQGPAASQFLHSLVSYAESDVFDPRVKLDESFAKAESVSVGAN